MKTNKVYLLIIVLFILACNSEKKQNKFIGKWRVYALIDSKNEIGGGKVFRNSIASEISIDNLDFELALIEDDTYIISGFYGSQIPVAKKDEFTLINQIGEKELKIMYDKETQHLFLNINNAIIEYERESNVASNFTNSTISKIKNTETEIKKYETLDLLDLIKLREEPNNTKLIKSKGYQYLETRHEEKYYVGTSKDTISIFYSNITWSGGIKNESLFNHLHEQAQNTSALTYDKEYSYDLIGDEPPTPIYRNNYTYFSEDGTEHSAIVFYSDESKTKPKNYIFYIGDSE